MARRRTVTTRAHRRLRRIDGSHPFKRRVPGGHVDYPARRVRGCEVVYVNFDLARTMGLIPPDHPDRLTPALERAVLDAFAIQIVNEHDAAHGAAVPEADRMPGTYMATRYLQLQHPDRVGRQSGDGRSVWLGTVRHRGTTWDVSACGTGVTRLCPATAETGRFFATGNDDADYACGTASLADGFEALLMSETFLANGIATERVLAILRRPDGFAINVRAARNLLRPSHFFVHLKQGNLAALRGVAGSFVDRQVDNGAWSAVPRGAARWRRMADEIAATFGALAATFEREYVFCWLDWDGDNILADGGIIDYGSVRQFGLFHREYRFDDGPRWSTTLAEQRGKAREIVRRFAQARDYLITGTRPALGTLGNDPTLARFDAAFRETRDRLLLRHAGFDARGVDVLLREHAATVRAFDRAHAHFERARSARGPLRLPDGITWNAVFSVRDLMRELPARLLESGGPLAAETIVDLAASAYAGPRDRRITRHRARMARDLQRAYLDLVEAAARERGTSSPRVLVEMARRSASINAFARITGDAVAHAAARIVRDRGRLPPATLHAVVRRFVERQTRVPEARGSDKPTQVRARNARRVFDALVEACETCAHGH